MQISLAKKPNTMSYAEKSKVASHAARTSCHLYPSQRNPSRSQSPIRPDSGSYPRGTYSLGWLLHIKKQERVTSRQLGAQSPWV